MSFEQPRGSTEKCPICGGSNFRTMTDFYKARCHFQYLIDNSLFCYDCIEAAVKKILDNPITNCDDCEGTPSCPSSPAAAAAIKQNYPIHQACSVDSPTRSANSSKSKSTGWKPCKRGESPRPKKSGYNSADREEIERGNIRYNKTKGYWEKKEEGKV